MKKINILTLSILMFSSFAFAAGEGAAKIPAKSQEVPVRINILKNPVKKHVPSRGVDGWINVNGDNMEFLLPLEYYPLVVEVEQLTEPYGYWTDTFPNSLSCVMDFGGTAGDYKLTVSAAEDTTYVGYFTLD